MKKIKLFLASLALGCSSVFAQSSDLGFIMTNTNPSVVAGDPSFIAAQVYNAKEATGNVKKFTLAWQLNDQAPNIDTITVSGDGLPPNSSLRGFIINKKQLKIDQAGKNRIKIWMEVLEGPADNNRQNDVIETDILAFEGGVDKKILLEEFTGTWCGWCPDGMERVEKLKEAYPNSLVAVMVHNRDNMAIQEGPALERKMNVKDFPSGAVDRFQLFGEAGKGGKAVDRGSWEIIMLSRYNQLVNTNPPSIPRAKSPVKVEFTQNEYNQSTREAKVKVKITFLADLTGDIRYNTYILEDYVSGTGNGWDQANYLSRRQGFENSKFYTMPSSIRGFQHMHVLRNVLHGADGNIIGTNVTKDQTVEFEYSFKLPNNYKAGDVQFATFVYNDAANGEVYNVEGIDLANLASNASILASNVGSFTVYPNPAQGDITFSYSLNTPSNVSIQILDISGKVIDSQDLGFQSVGEQTVGYDASALNSGIYIVKLVTDSGQTTSKFIVR